MKLYRIGGEDLSSVAGFMTLGLMMGQMGPLLSAASVDLGIDAQAIGTTISVFFGVSIIGIVMGLFWIRPLGKERFLLLASALLGVAYAGGLAIRSPLGLTGITVLTGLGLGMYQIGINSLAVDRTSSWKEADQAGRIAFLQFFFGVGAVLAPLLVDLSHLRLHNWRLSYGMVLLLGPVAVALGMLRDLRQQRSGLGAERDTVEETLDRSLRHPIQWKLPLVMVLCVAAIYTALETSMFNWLSFYWDQRFEGVSWITGARASAVFWLIFSLSRAGMGVVVAQLGAWRSLLSFALLMGLLFAVWVGFAPGPWGLLPIVVGIALLMGCMFPTILVLISRQQPGESSQIIGVLFVLITASATVAPVGIGQVCKRFDISLYPWTLLGIAVLLIAGLLSARELRRRAKSRLRQDES